MRSTFPRAKGLAGVVLSSASAIVSISVGGCTAVVNDVTEYCSTTADCASRGGGYENSVCRDGLCRAVAAVTPPPPPDDGPWSCVGKVEYKEPMGLSVGVNLRLIDPISGGPLPGLAVKPCGRLDPNCTMPLTGEVATDALGSARLVVSTVAATSDIPGFSGYFDISGEGRIPNLFFVVPPVVADHEANFPVPAPEQAAAFTAILGQAQLPDRSTVIVIAKNCLSAPTPGLTLRVLEGDNDTRAYYAEGVAPSPSATQTSASGIVFILNVKPGNATLSATLVSTGQEVARSSVLTRSGGVTTVELEPTPLLEYNLSTEGARAPPSLEYSIA